jgi:hypothetical protein
MLLCGMLMSLAACRSDSVEDPGAATEKPAAAPTNRINIPAAVRSNLGITFARVERRQVSDMIRVPGRFELLPSATREYRMPLPGRVELRVGQFDAVEAGTTLYAIDSPDWRSLQREIEDTSAAIDIAEAQLASLDPIMEAHQLHEQGLREAVELWTERVRQLEELGAAGGGRAAELAEAQASLTAARASFGEVLEKDAELALRRAETQSALRASRSKLELLLNSAATILGVPRESMGVMARNQAAPMWKSTALIEIRAGAAGTVADLPTTNGAWAEQGEAVLVVVNPEAVRFRAVGLQSDLKRLRAGLPASITPPQGSDMGAEDSIPTELQIGLTADPERRTLDLFALPTRLTAWSRPGVSAFLEIALDRTAEPELAIPLSSVVRDGVTPIIFRRDPANGDRVIRMEADLGLDDGRWIVVNSGVKQGDEIVLEGAFQLLLASSGSTPKGGHFHSDGTFHEGGHE